MMNHLTSMKTAWNNLVSSYISMLYAQRLLEEVLNHFAERCRVGYENFFHVREGV